MDFVADNWQYIAIGVMVVDKIVNPEKEEGDDPNVNFTASDWILFK